MKKIKLLVLFFILIVSLTACNKDVNDEFVTDIGDGVDSESSIVESDGGDETEQTSQDFNESFPEDVEIKDSSNVEAEVLSLDYGLYNLNMDYESGNISTDEYVRYQLYDFFGDARLDRLYESTGSSPIDFNRLVEENLSELSEETLRYYWDKFTLNGIVSFNDAGDSYEEVSNKRWKFKNPFVLEVQAEEGVEAYGELLDKVVVSSNDNFVIWYSSSVDSPVTEAEARDIAETLENNILEFEKLTNISYTFEGNRYKKLKGEVYNNQKKVLIKNGYDESYLEDAMQVYIASLGTDRRDTFAFYYQGMADSLSEFLVSLIPSDANGCAVFPYIFINRDTFYDFENVKQLVSHEIFHHFQTLIAGEDSVGGDDLISEATANWFSAKVNNVVEGNLFLNQHASSMIRLSDRIFTYVLHNYDKSSIGYLLFPYFQLYEKHVDGGVDKILSSIKVTDGLAYLEEQSMPVERVSIMKDLVLHNLKQEPYNGVTLGSPDMVSFPPIGSEISSDKIDGYISVNKRIEQLHIDYHRVTLNPEWPEADNYIIDYSVKESSDYSLGNIWLYVIGAKNDSGATAYSLLSSHSLYDEEESYQISADIFKYYDQIYFAVSNASLTSSSYYSLNVNWVHEEGDDIASDSESDLEDTEFISDEELYEYCYQMALSVRMQVDEFFNAIKTGDIQTVWDYSYKGTTADDWDDDSFYHLMNYESAPRVLQLLLGKIEYYFSDNMVEELALELKDYVYKNKNEDEYVLLQFPRSEPVGWLSNACYVESFDNGTLLEKLNYPGYCTEEEALEVIEKCTSNMYMGYRSDRFGVIEIGKDFSATINVDLDSLLSSYTMPKAIKHGELLEERYYLSILAEDLSLDEVIVGTTSHYVDNKEQYDLLESYWLQKDFKGLENFLLQVLDQQYCDEIIEDKTTYGSYEELTNTQKEFVDMYIAKNYKLKVIDYTSVNMDYFSDDYEISSAKGCFYIFEQPVEVYKFNSFERNSRDYEEIIAWCSDNNIKNVHYDWVVDSSDNMSNIYTEMYYFLCFGYYHLIDYARNNIQ